MVGKRKETRRVKRSGESNKKRGRSRGEYQLRRASNSKVESMLYPSIFCAQGTVYRSSQIQRIYTLISIIE